MKENILYFSPLEDSNLLRYSGESDYRFGEFPSYLDNYNINTYSSSNEYFHNSGDFCIIPLRYKNGNNILFKKDCIPFEQERDYPNLGRNFLSERKDIYRFFGNILIRYRVNYHDEFTCKFLTYDVDFMDSYDSNKRVSFKYNLTGLTHADKRYRINYDFDIAIVRQMDKNNELQLILANINRNDGWRYNGNGVSQFVNDDFKSFMIYRDSKNNIKKTDLKATEFSKFNDLNKFGYIQNFILELMKFNNSYYY